MTFVSIMGSLLELLEQMEPVSLLCSCDYGYSFPFEGEVMVGICQCQKHCQLLAKTWDGFSGPDDQLFMTTVYDDVAFGPRNYKLDEKEVENRVIQALDMVGISHLKDKAPFKLSGGEKRAAAIASVLSMKPEVLIMDEPTAALDPKSRRRVIGLLKGFEQTKIITSHDLDMVLEVCKRVIVIKDGRIIADGNASEILVDVELMDSCGLEVPLRLQGCPVCGRKWNV